MYFGAKPVDSGGKLLAPQLWRCEIFLNVNLQVLCSDSAQVLKPGGKVTVYSNSSEILLIPLHISILLCAFDSLFFAIKKKKQYTKFPDCFQN